MAVNFLDFEQPIAELEAKIEELKHVPSGSAVNIQEEITRLQAKSEQLTQTIFANLTPWQITQLARHPQRPYTLDYAGSDLQGLPRSCMATACMATISPSSAGPRASTTRRDAHRPPEGTRHQGTRAPQLRHAQARGLPQGAAPHAPRREVSAAAHHVHRYPRRLSRRESEERNQSEAIARNLFEMSVMGIPIISCVIGEGGSGGALAIGVCDRLLMLQFSTTR
jgi:acetyl-CoA carboxylase carboxyl transferase subunit alpha